MGFCPFSWRTKDFQSLLYFSFSDDSTNIDVTCVSKCEKQVKSPKYPSRFDFSQFPFLIAHRQEVELNKCQNKSQENRIWIKDTYSKLLKKMKRLSSHRCLFCIQLRTSFCLRCTDANNFGSGWRKIHKYCVKIKAEGPRSESKCKLERSRFVLFFAALQFILLHTSACSSLESV